MKDGGKGVFRGVRRVIATILRNLRALTLLATLAICVYFLARTIILYQANYRKIELLFGILLLLAESFILIHSVGYAANIFRIPFYPKDDARGEKNFLSKAGAPKIAVVIPARHEPKEILEDTIVTISNMDYPNFEVFLLDDSSEPSFKREARGLARKYKIGLFSRKERHGAKAGVINDFLKNCDAKYLAIFDADQNPMPDFLKKTAGIMESDPKIAFVQTPQFYTNISAGPVPEGAAMQQAIFFEHICEGKSESNAIFCCGTNVLVRVSDLRGIGGFDEESITEDFSTSLRLHLAGKSSVYYPHVSAFGMGPETLQAYFKQQARWASGTISAFSKNVLRIILRPGALSFSQTWEYFLSGTYYMMGWVFLLLMLFPAAFILFNIPSYFVKPEIYIGAFVPYFALTALLFYHTMAMRNYSFSQTFKGIVLGFLSFPILIRASIYGMLGKKVPFVVTDKSASRRGLENVPFVHLVFLAINIGAFLFGIYRILRGDDFYAIGMNTFWIGYHIFLLLHIFVFARWIPEKDGTARGVFG